MGKLDEGKIGTLFTEFNLPELIADTNEDMKGILKKGQHIDFKHEGVDIILTDRKMLKNILINLISNAVKFSDENTAITIRSKANENVAVICVKD